jgi:4-amino-4-deoxy-L-arabinose transferase-like glycosyltransferase
MRAFRDYLGLPSVIVLAILIAGAAARFYFADANSYWLDELYSVVVYGTAHDSVLDAIRRLTRSAHPPLYQFILYYWMVVFGDSEVATRSLSNLYIVGATLCLYLAVRKIYGAWLGVIVALVFTLMFTPTYYGMETRSYAQTIFLSSLSTLCLVYALPRIAEKSWRALLKDGWFYAFLAANTALLMTHYYNAMFLAAQGVFLIIYLLFRSKPAFAAIAKAFAVGIVPVIVLLLVWGSVMMKVYDKNSERYMVDGMPTLPWETLLARVIQPNFESFYTYYAVVLLIALVTVTTLVKVVRRTDDETLFTLWLVLATLTPVLFAFLLFLFSGHQRYSDRYFAFSVGPLSVLVVLGIYQMMTLLSRLVPVLSRVALLATAVLAVYLVYPGGSYGLARPKADWRGIAEAVVERINREPNKKFVVYETTYRNYPTLNYYLSRFSNDIRVQKILQRRFERKKGPISFAVPNADYAIVTFTHQKTKHFPRTLEAFDRDMTLQEKHFNSWSHGYLVYSIP